VVNRESKYQPVVSEEIGLLDSMNAFSPLSSRGSSVKESLTAHHILCHLLDIGTSGRMICEHSYWPGWILGISSDSKLTGGAWHVFCGPLSGGLSHCAITEYSE